MRHWLTLFAFLLFTATAPAATAPPDSVRNSRRLRILPVPAFGYAPETRFYLGAVALATWHPGRADTRTRPANAKAEVNVTQNRQLILTTEWTRFSPGERSLSQGQISFLRFPEDYWGVGNQAPDAARERYDSRRFEARVSWQARLRPALYLGPRAVVQNLWDVAPAADGLLARGAVPGARGGWSVGAGAGLTYDTRPNLLTPRRGAYGALAVTAFGPALDSDFRFTRYELDLRRYWPAGKVIVAGQFYATAHSGEPPFRMLALLGSDGPMRGYYRGRFRDRQLLTGQAEVRFPIVGRFGAVAFAGAGQVARGWSGLGFGALKPSMGGGLRFLIDRQEDINLRVDYAVGRGTSGFYLSFGEAF